MKITRRSIGGLAASLIAATSMLAAVPAAAAPSTPARDNCGRSFSLGTTSATMYLSGNSCPSQRLWVYCAGTDGTTSPSKYIYSTYFTKGSRSLNCNTIGTQNRGSQGYQIGNGSLVPAS